MCPWKSFRRHTFWDVCILTKYGQMTHGLSCLTTDLSLKLTQTFQCDMHTTFRRCWEMVWGCERQSCITFRWLAVDKNKNVENHRGPAHHCRGCARHQHKSLQWATRHPANKWLSRGVSMRRGGPNFKTRQISCHILNNVDISKWAPPKKCCKPKDVVAKELKLRTS